jgi:O-antigen/teichoic acid export membrane protein
MPHRVIRRSLTGLHNMFVSGLIVRVKTRYTGMPLPVKAAFWFTVCSFLQRGISFITVPMFTRLLSAEDYGFTSIYYSWSGIFSIIVTLNLGGGGFNNAMLKYRDQRDSYCSAISCLCVFFGFVWFVLCAFFYRALSMFVNLPIGLIGIMLLEILFAQIFTVWASRQRFEFKYRALAVVTLFITVIASVVSIVFVYFARQKAFARIIAHAAVCIAIYLFIFLFFILRKKFFFNKGYWKFALGFNIPLVPHYLSQMVLNQADRIMIASYCGNKYAGIYSVSYNFSLALMILIQSVNSSFAPWIYGKLETKSYNDIKKISSLLICFFAILTIMPILIGPEIIYILAPVEYFEAIYVIPSVGLSVFFVFLYGLFASASFYYGKTVFIAAGSAMVALCNVLLNALFIPRFGYLAAGYTTLACYILYSVVHYSFMRHIAKKEKYDAGMFDLRLIFVVSVLLLIVSLSMTALYRFIIPRYVIILLSAVILFIKRNEILALLQRLKKRT